LVLPDGCIDLIWQEGVGVFVAGPDTGPAPSELPPEAVLAGARFWPGAGGPALGLPLAELRDQRVGLTNLRRWPGGDIPSDLPPRLALAALAELSASMVTARPPDPLVLQATRMLADGQANVTALGPALQVSERQLLRRFDHAVGYGPKTMHRILRFCRVVEHLSDATKTPDLASLAIRAGYADQAHLTRETTRLAGQPPAALARSLAAGRPAPTGPQPPLARPPR
jgi:AraC-like DNA-binding protein